MEEQALAVLASLHPVVAVVLAVLGLVVVVSQAVVLLTPSTKDDEFWEKMLAVPFLGGIIKALAVRAPIQKKPKE